MGARALHFCPILLFAGWGEGQGGGGEAGKGVCVYDTCSGKAGNRSRILVLEASFDEVTGLAEN